MPRKATDIDIGKLPMKSEPRCNICMSKSRSKVDKLLASGAFSYTAVAEELVESDNDFKDKEVDTVRKNVERHAKRHLDIRNKAIREIVERRAKEQGILLDQATGKITTGRALLDLIVAKGTEQITDPSSKVRYADVIEAVKMLEDVQKQEYQYELERLQRQVTAITEAVKEIVPETLIPTLVARAEQIYENDQVLELTA
jgi:hypothetical protein